MALLLVAVLAGCGGDDAAEDDNALTAPVTPSVEGTIEPGLEAIAQQAIRDLAARLDVTEHEIIVVSAEAMQWSDTSLGCPQPGMRYQQVPQDGARVVLRAQGETFQYHSGGGRGPFLCEQPSKGATPSPGGSIDR